MQTCAEVAVVRLCGDFDVADRGRLTQAFAGVLYSQSVVVDLTQVGYVDLTLINCLIALEKARRGRGMNGHRIILRGAGAHIRRLLGIVRLEGLFALDENAGDGDGLRPSCEIIVRSQ